MPDPTLSPSDLEAVRAAVDRLQMEATIHITEYGLGMDGPNLVADIMLVTRTFEPLLALAEAAAREHEQLRIATQALDFIVEQNGALPSAEVVAEDALIQISVAE